jgi:hypothetical protein
MTDKHTANAAQECLLGALNRALAYTRRGEVERARAALKSAQSYADKWAESTPIKMDWGLNEPGTPEAFREKD